jgi:hypothetical protein
MLRRRQREAVHEHLGSAALPGVIARTSGK